MTPEKQDEVKKNARHLPEGVTIADIVGENNKKQSADEVRIKFGKNNICSPAVIHLAYEENKMTLVINPFWALPASMINMWMSPWKVREALRQNDD